MRRFTLVLVLWILVGPFPPNLAEAGEGERISVTNFGDMEVVVFNHSRHAEDSDCSICHHVKGSDGGHRCGACHLSEGSGSRISLEDAAHREGVGKCWKCHFSKQARKKLDCENCHRGVD